MGRSSPVAQLSCTAGPMLGPAPAPQRACPPLPLGDRLLRRQHIYPGLQGKTAGRQVWKWLCGWVCGVWGRGGAEMGGGVAVRMGRGAVACVGGERPKHSTIVECHVRTSAAAARAALPLPFQCLGMHPITALPGLPACHAAWPAQAALGASSMHARLACMSGAPSFMGG